MKQINRQKLSELASTAAASPRLRANFNLHPELADPIQRLAIAMEPGTYVRPHRHPHTWELLFPLQGRFLVLHFDEAGKVIDRAILGEGAAILETPAGQWHAVLSLDEGGVIFEVKHGPYQAIAEQDYTSWSPAEGEPGVVALMAWYATAQIGDRYGN
ncbi:WbuC family cupin fold metalloprotein [Silvimonas soli]|uniref:WbuC family cupin fold metalloprotein n=1 Tax=Silvimonas soli TaxID=2980100 RepID=UPI0024B321F6|nr:WbuC family cupin fold metalloprotein [Silvimonas soli]